VRREHDQPVAEASGFSLHAGVIAEGGEREKIERLCRYVSRPAVASERLALTPQGNVRYTLKTPYRDGTTHVILEPLAFIARLAALVPLPRVHLTRYHGVFAPNHRWRGRITPGRGGRLAQQAAGQASVQRYSPTWMQRLKRVFAIDIETCRRCGGRLKVIASIEEPEVIERILAHLDRAEPAVTPFAPQAPPPSALV